MQVIEQTLTNESGEKFIRITFTEHRAEIFRKDIPIKHERCAALRFAQAKEQAIEEFLETFNGEKYTKKEVIKAWAKKDEYFKDVFKQLYPHGGRRSGGGRKTGTKKFSDKTERLNQSITKEEKEFLTKVLQDFRQDEEQVKKALAPYIRQIESRFGDDVEGLKKWQERMSKMNPAMLVYMLEYFAVFGVDSVVPIGIRK